LGRDVFFAGRVPVLFVIQSEFQLTFLLVPDETLQYHCRHHLYFVQFVLQNGLEFESSSCRRMVLVATVLVVGIMGCILLWGATRTAGTTAMPEMGDGPEDEPGTGTGDDEINDDVDHEMALLSGAKPQ
jgi:hypothetical protein